MTEQTNKIDLTRLNRHERRANGKIMGEKIHGRNLPYRKDIYGTVENYYNLRKEEITKEEEYFKNNK